MRIFCKYHICNKSATTWHHVQIHKKAKSLQHIGNRWLRGICSPATGAKIYAKTFICLYAKMAKMSDFSNHNIFAYMLASCANLNFHPVQTMHNGVTHERCADFRHGIKKKQKRGEFITPPRPTGRRSNYIPCNLGCPPGRAR